MSKFFWILILTLTWAIFSTNAFAHNSDNRIDEVAETREVLEWARTYSNIKGIRLEYQSDLSGHSKSRVRTRQNCILRWPDCFIEEIIEEKESDVPLDRPQVRDPLIVLLQVITPSGELVQRSVDGSYTRVIGYGILAEHAPSQFRIQPWVVARFLMASGMQGVSVRKSATGLTAELPSDNCRLVFEKDPAFRLAAVESLAAKSGKVVDRYVFTDYRKVDGVPVTIPFKISRFTSLEAEHVDPLPLESEQMLTSAEALVDPPDSLFTAVIPENTPKNKLRIISDVRQNAIDSPSNSNPRQNRPNPTSPQGWSTIFALGLGVLAAGWLVHKAILPRKTRRSV